MRRIEASLAAAGFTLSRDSVAGRQAVIGRSPGWRRPAFVLVAVFKDCTRDHLDRFLVEAAEYTAAVKGGLRGGASGVVAVAVAESAPDVAGWATGGGDVVPVLVEAGRAAVTFPDGATPLHRLVRDHVVRTMGGSG